MNFVELIGYCAAFCTTIAFLPQAIKVIRSGDTASLSMGMYIFFTLGVALWLVYGFMLRDKALIFANSITFILAACILSIKVYREVIAGASR